jgi:hypothetical protein
MTPKMCQTPSLAGHYTAAWLQRSKASMQPINKGMNREPKEPKKCHTAPATGPAAGHRANFTVKFSCLMQFRMCSTAEHVLILSVLYTHKLSCIKSVFGPRAGLYHWLTVTANAMGVGVIC